MRCDGTDVHPESEETTGPGLLVALVLDIQQLCQTYISREHWFQDPRTVDAMDPFCSRIFHRSLVAEDCMDFLHPENCDHQFATQMDRVKLSAWALSEPRSKVGRETVTHQFVHDVTDECKESLEDSSVGKDCFQLPAIVTPHLSQESCAYPSCPMSS